MVFDPKQFLGLTVSGPMATKITPVPEGEWLAIISTKQPVAEWFDEAEWKDKKSGQTKTQPTCKVPFEITDSRAKELVKRETLMVNYDMFLDLLPNGQLDTGEDKNVRLGALREALGQNSEPSWTFERLFGAGPVMVKIVHRKDDKRPDDTFPTITRVAKVS